jgi:predicted dehydrogenase
MSQNLNVALVGIGGYGSIYVSAMLDHAHEHAATLVGGADPRPQGCKRLAELQARDIPIFASMEALYAAVTPDVVVLSSPIQLHAEQTAYALARGSHVLCEKPLAATVGQGLAMQAARDRAGRQVAIGYQWSFCPVNLAAKRDIRAGRFGAARTLRTLVMWPRDEAYYGRNRWAGRVRDDAGMPVYDSPVNNACAHYLHSMLYMLGDRVDSSAEPVRTQAELFRANAIENFDTAVVRTTTSSGAQLIFVVTHASAENVGPLFEYAFEKGTLSYGGDAGDHFVARFADGSTHDYGKPDDSVAGTKLWTFLESLRRQEPTVCGIEAALSHTRVVEALQQIPVREFPRDLVTVSGQAPRRKTIVRGLDDDLRRCYQQGKLPSELQLAWATDGRSRQTIPA